MSMTRSTTSTSTSSEGTVVDKSTTTTELPDGSQQIAVTTHIRKSDGTITKKTVTRTVFSSRGSCGDLSSDLFLAEFGDIESSSAARLLSQHVDETRSFLEGREMVCNLPHEHESVYREDSRASSSSLPKNLNNNSNDMINSNNNNIAVNNVNRVTFSNVVDVAESPEETRIKQLKTPLFKNKKCHAIIMIIIVWGTAATLLVMTFVFNWFLDSNNEQNQLSCTLCDQNGLDFQYLESKLTPWPTRQPSSTALSNQINDFLGIASGATLKPPPENLNQICSPSILLNHGVEYKGASSEALVATCTKICIPAVCCVASNDKAKEGLLALLEMQGMGAQASAYLASMKDCKSGDNTAVCDAYSAWCGTLFDLDSVLRISVKNHMDSVCSFVEKEDEEEEESDSLLLASSRYYKNFGIDASDQCSNSCRSVECCYKSMEDSSRNAHPVIERKRKRQHEYDNDWGVVRATQGEVCQQFRSVEGSATNKICSAYASYCSPDGTIPNQDTNTTSSVFISAMTRAPITPTAIGAAPVISPSLAPFGPGNNSTNSMPSLSNIPTPTMTRPPFGAYESNLSNTPTLQTSFTNETLGDSQDGTVENMTISDGYCINSTNCKVNSSADACANAVGCIWNQTCQDEFEGSYYCEQYNELAGCEEILGCEWVIFEDGAINNNTFNDTDGSVSSNSSIISSVPSSFPSVLWPTNYLGSIANTKQPTHNQVFNISNPPSIISADNSTSDENGEESFSNGTIASVTPTLFPTISNSSNTNTSQPTMSQIPNIPGETGDSINNETVAFLPSNVSFVPSPSSSLTPTMQSPTGSLEPSGQIFNTSNYNGTSPSFSAIPTPQPSPNNFTFEPSVDSQNMTLIPSYQYSTIDNSSQLIPTNSPNFAQSKSPQSSSSFPMTQPPINQTSNPSFQSPTFAPSNNSTQFLTSSNETSFAPTGAATSALSTNQTSAPSLLQLQSPTFSPSDNSTQFLSSLNNETSFAPTSAASSSSGKEIISSLVPSPSTTNVPTPSPVTGAPTVSPLALITSSQPTSSPMVTPSKPSSAISLIIPSNRENGVTP